MRASPSPRLHLFVCANRRDDATLGSGCAERGDALYGALKTEVAARGKVNEIWVTKTHCLGICPKDGATVARYPDDMPIRSDVQLGDVDALLASETNARGTTTIQPSVRDETWDAIDKHLRAIEDLQTKKVLDLARRLKPGLTMEDVQNPHDFPELDDSDWHYADGILTGTKSVTSALRALRRDGDS